MNASLHSIVSSKIHSSYVIKFKLANGDEYYAQMRLHRYTKTIYLCYCYKSLICFFNDLLTLRSARQRFVGHNRDPYTRKIQECIFKVIRLGCILFINRHVYPWKPNIEIFINLFAFLQSKNSLYCPLKANTLVYVFT